MLKRMPLVPAVQESTARVDVRRTSTLSAMPQPIANGMRRSKATRGQCARWGRKVSASAATTCRGRPRLLMYSVVGWVYLGSGAAGKKFVGVSFPDVAGGLVATSTIRIALVGHVCALAG